MADRRGFLRSLFTAPAAVAAWATVAKAEKPKEMAKPNCLLAEQDEVWTLADGFKIPVRRIEVKLDFHPAVTWEVGPSPEELVAKDVIKTVDDYSQALRAATVRRMVFPRFSEFQLRLDYHLQKMGHDPIGRPQQVKDASEYKTYAQLDMERDEVVQYIERGDKTPFETILRNRMTNCWLGWQPGELMGPNRRITEAGTSDPHGVFAVFNSPGSTLYTLGVSGYRITSANMLLQAPASSLFG
jgi:hypothetical protein